MNIRFSGFGGQGIILAGVIYGSGATLDGKNVVQTQSYGSASRGGACKCDVIISDEHIFELQFPNPDILISLSQQAYDKYSPQLKEKGILIIDKDLVTPKKDHHSLHSVSFTDIAFKKFRRNIIANMVVLGYMTALLNLISKKAVSQAIRENAPPGTEDINIKAFQEGYRLGIKHIKTG
jgi:2-oxoglutarate ferredoxin oxidoreductase subunit gamma